MIGDYLPGVEVPAQREIHSSYRQWEEFLETAIWVDIKGHFEDLQAQLIRLISDSDNADTLDKVREYQAGLRLCNEILRLPESFMEDIKTQQEQRLELDEEKEDGRRSTI